MKSLEFSIEILKEIITLQGYYYAWSSPQIVPSTVSTVRTGHTPAIETPDVYSPPPLFNTSPQWGRLVNGAVIRMYTRIFDRKTNNSMRANDAQYILIELQGR